MSAPRVDWSRYRLLIRLREASSLDLADLERVALALLSSGASRADLARALQGVLDGMVEWTVLVPGLGGRLLERAERVALALLAAEIARALSQTWERLSASERGAWVADLLTAAADARTP